MKEKVSRGQRTVRKSKVSIHSWQLSSLEFIVFMVFCKTHTRLEIFAAVKIRVMVFWVMTPCSNVVGHQCFRALCSSISRVKWIAVFFLAPFISPWRWR